MKASVRKGSDFAVDIRDVDIDGMNEVNLLVQAGNNGYQLDLFWETDDGEKNQSNNWVNFNPQSHDYPHDNTHERTPYLREFTHGIKIIDEEPRAESVGYEGATLEITRSSPVNDINTIEGYLVELTWVDEYNEVHTNKSLVPLVDPRKNREKYYTLMSKY